MADETLGGGYRPLSPEEAGRRYDRSLHAVRQHIRFGGLPHHRINGRIVIMEHELAEWLKKPQTVAMLARGQAMKDRSSPRRRLASSQAS